jgi:hypothetical protein
LGRSPNTRKTKKNPLDQKLDGFLKIVRSAMGIDTATFKFGNLVSFLFAEMDGWHFLAVAAGIVAASSNTSYFLRDRPLYNKNRRFNDDRKR